jgi:hypothetical protein
MAGALVGGTVPGIPVTRQQKLAILTNRQLLLNCVIGL